MTENVRLELSGSRNVSSSEERLRGAQLVMGACDLVIRVPYWQIGQVISPYLQLGFAG